jgi:hypothetical protein
MSILHSTYDFQQKKEIMQTFPHRTTDTQIGGILVPSFREIFSFSNVKSDSKRKESLFTENIFVRHIIMNSGHVQALFFYFMPISFRFPESRHVAGGIQNFISIFWVTHQTEHTLSSGLI